MNRKYVFSLAAAAIGSGVIAISAAHAYGFGHHGHHGSGAAKACIAVMTHDEKMGLKTIFSDAKTNIIADHKSAAAAKHDLELAIVKNPKGDFSALETSLANAKSKLQQDQDKVAAEVCGSLNSQQMGAAEGLYKNLLALRESTHSQARAFFKDARTAAGDPAVQMQSTTQDAE